jgi:hypothetical protein
MKMFKSVVAILLAGWVASTISACEGSDMDCGPGTHQEGGFCVPDISECGLGTVLDNGQCKSACAEDEYWTGEACESLSGCALGTVFDETLGECVIACQEDEYWDGQACIQVAGCASGTKFNPQTKECDPACGEEEYWDGQQCSSIYGCAPGTSFDPETQMCVPACGDGQYWDGQACSTLPICDAGTVFNPESGECELACPAETYWDGLGCAPVPGCATGTEFHAEINSCLPSGDACRQGSTLVGNICIPDLVCAEDTHAENGICVPDTLPQVDVYEIEDPESLAQEFELPQIGGTISLGGIVELPKDLNGDGSDDFDADGFLFSAQAGTYLRITAQSESGLLPAFLLRDYEEGKFPTYERYGVGLDGLTVREVFLPKSGQYILWMSDYSNIMAYAYNTSAILVGGDDFRFYVSIEHLAAPTPTAISEMPFSQAGTISDGNMLFYSFVGSAQEEFIGIESIGLPVENKLNDVTPILMLFNANKELIDSKVIYNFGTNCDMLIESQLGSEYFVVLDHLMIIGHKTEYLFTADALNIEDCSVTDCSSGALTAGEDVILKWNLAPGDFFVAGIYIASDVQLLASLIGDPSAISMANQFVNPLADAAFWTYAKEAKPIYIWLRYDFGYDELGAYSLDARIHQTAEISAGGPNYNLEVFEMPPYTLPQAAIEHIVGVPGKILMFGSIQGSSEWNEPWQTITSRFIQSDHFDAPYNGWMDPVGPVADTNYLPSGAITPLFVYLKDDDHYLHWVIDPSSDIGNATYNVGTWVYDLTELGMPTAEAPVEATEQSLSSMGFYSFIGQENQYVEITVDPIEDIFGMFDSKIQPKIWVMNFGRAIFYWFFYIWMPDPDAPRLGLVYDDVAAASGETLVSGYVSAYDGLNIVLVTDESGLAGDFDFFDVRISVPPPPTNDVCSNAEPIELGAEGHASIETNFGSATNTVTDLGCELDSAPGPDLFYSILLEEGDRLNLSLNTPGFVGVLHLFQDCLDVATSCLAGAQSGFPTVVSHEVLEGASGTYYIGLDSWGVSGDFELDVSVSAGY